MQEIPDQVGDDGKKVGDDGEKVRDDGKKVGDDGKKVGDDGKKDVYIIILIYGYEYKNYHIRF